MYTDPGNSIFTKTEDEWGLENHRIFLMKQPVQDKVRFFTKSCGLILVSHTLVTFFRDSKD